MVRAMSRGPVITGSGVWAPEPVLTNDAMCAVFNEWVRTDNERNAAAIAAGEREPLQESSAEFIVKASGITQRHVVTLDGLLDPERMHPLIPDRPDDELAVQTEMALRAAELALRSAGRDGQDVDMITVACSKLQRAYPAIAMELQHALGAKGFALDMTVGCSSATFPVQFAVDTIRCDHARTALLVNPELMSPQVNWRDRDSHFIFGDAAAALVVEAPDAARSANQWEILGTKLWSKFSSNIRNNGGYLDRCDPERMWDADKLFYQQGRRVFKDIVPLVPQFIGSHLDELGVEVGQLDRLWLHQANINMDQLIAKRLLGREASEAEMPTVLNEYANTASAGSIIAFTEHHDDLPVGAHGVICSFGAGYSAGNVVVRRVV